VNLLTSKMDKFNAQAKITKDFKFSVGMEFTSQQQFKDIVREHNVLNGRKIKFAKNDKRRVKAVCKFNQKCGYNVYVSMVTSAKTFRVTSLCLNHTCEMVFANLEKTEGLEQQLPEVLIDGEPLNQNQEVSADGEKHICGANFCYEPCTKSC